MRTERKYVQQCHRYKWLCLLSNIIFLLKIQLRHIFTSFHSFTDLNADQLNRRVWLRIVSQVMSWAQAFK